MQRISYIRPTKMPNKNEESKVITINPNRSSTIPVLNISFTSNNPVEYAIIVGGVPITIAKSTEAAMATRIAKTIGDIPRI